MKGMLCTALFMVATVSCGTDDPPPSCQQAFTHYYAAGCAYHDLNTQQEIPRDTMIANCQSVAASAPPTPTPRWVAMGTLSASM
jgi:hypothetical protein